MPAERYEGRSVLVTGAQGFVGSWLTERLLAEGARVVVLRRDAEPESRFHTEGIEERCVLAQADLLDYEELLRVLNEHEVTAVFHLAAQTIVGTANRSPLSTFETNVRGTYLLLEACRAVGVVGDPVERGRGGLLGQGLRRARRAALPGGLRRCSRATPTTSRRRART